MRTSIRGFMPSRGQHRPQPPFRRLSRGSRPPVVSAKWILSAVAAVALAGALFAQLGGLATQEWGSTGGDALRDRWIRHDDLISPKEMATNKFGFLWKLKIDAHPRGPNSLSSA